MKLYTCLTNIMSAVHLMVMAATLVVSASASNLTYPTRKFELRLPSAKPSQPDTYVCTGMRVDTNTTYYLVAFEALAQAKVVHHMLLYGCKTPGKKDPLFNCGTMTARQSGLPWSLAPCGSGSQVVYAWASDAPSLELPEGVGFKVGVDSGVDWLVLQVHYATTKFIHQETGDRSGVSITYTNVPMPKLAGVWYSNSNGRMPGGSETKVEAACQVQTNRDLHPMAFRVHTHQLGTAVSGWKVTNHQDWTLLGRKDPQLPQAFYPVEDNSTVIRNGDVIAARCTMDNWRDSAVYMGSTRQDEMCNFYLMYWADAGDGPVETSQECRSLGPPIYYWSRSKWLLGGGLSNVPDQEASYVPPEDTDYWCSFLPNNRIGLIIDMGYHPIYIGTGSFCKCSNVYFRYNTCLINTGRLFGRKE